MTPNDPPNSGEAGENTEDGIDDGTPPQAMGGNGADELDVEPGGETRAFLDRRRAESGVGRGPESGELTVEPGDEPAVSVTIEGTYDAVFNRLEHPQASKHRELDVIVRNIEETYLAVLKTGGGIRSEIYEAVEFELDQPWEIRIYLEVLAMHDLARLHDDRWVPTDVDRTGSDA